MYVEAYAELHVTGKESDALVFEQRRLGEGGSDNTFLATESTEESMGELGSSYKPSTRSRY